MKWTQTAPSCPDPLWDPKCMSMLDWGKIQAEDQVISYLIQWYKAKELHKGKDTDSLEMKQFHKQRGKLLLRNWILYSRNDIKKLKAQTGTLCN